MLRKAFLKSLGCVVLVGVVLVCTTKSAIDAQAFSNHEEIPYIGAVRRILDTEGRETPWFVPVLDTRAVRRLAADSYLPSTDDTRMYLSLIQTEGDPDTRRHYIHEIVTSATNQPDWIAAELMNLLSSEWNAEVRTAYIAGLLSLAVLSQPQDATLLGIIDVLLEVSRADPSGDVRVRAACALTWFGEARGIDVLEDAAAGRLSVQAEIMNSVPGALQRIDTERSHAVLEDLATAEADDRLRVTALWTAYQSGLASEEDVLADASWVCRTSASTIARATAIATLVALAAASPSHTDLVSSAIAACMLIEQDPGLRAQMQHALNQLGEK